jgi:hypothetical protein
LSIVRARQFSDRLCLNEKVFVADEIRSLAAAQQVPFVAYRQWHLGAKWYLSILELKSESALIHRLEKSESELAMHFHRCSDDRVTLWILLHF